jgi:hypothetical protein
MATFKKTAFKKKIKESIKVDEFVTDDGAVISGDEKYNKDVEITTGPINLPGDDKGISPTTDDHATSAIQPRNWWWSLSYGYGQGSGKSPVGSNLGLQGASYGSFDESIDESNLTSEQRMKKMVEDIMTNRAESKGLVNRGDANDVNRNKIPDIEDLNDTNMIVVGKVDDMMDTIATSNLSGEEVGIVLNHLLDTVDTSKIPSDYKRIIRNKI